MARGTSCLYIGSGRSSIYIAGLKISSCISLNLTKTCVIQVDKKQYHTYHAPCDPYQLYHSKYIQYYIYIHVYFTGL